MKTFKIKNLILVVGLMLLQVFNVVAQTHKKQAVAVSFLLNKEYKLNFVSKNEKIRKGTISAQIKRDSNEGTWIDIKVNDLPRPFEFGSVYTTFSLWAVSEYGQFENLGEFYFSNKKKKIDSSLKTKTKLQTFALVVSAEPHYLVTEPSPEILFESAATDRDNKENIKVYYQVNDSAYFIDSLIPEAIEMEYLMKPTLLLQAQQSILMAQFFEAEIYATEELNKAKFLLKQAESSWNKKNEDFFEPLARQAILSGSFAEILALQRKKQKVIEQKLNELNDENQKYRNRLIEITGQLDLKKLEVENLELKLKQITELLSKTENQNLLLEQEKIKLNLQITDLKLEIGRIRATNERLSLLAELQKFGKVAEKENTIILTPDENIFAEQFGQLDNLLTNNLTDMYQKVKKIPQTKIIIEINFFRANQFEDLTESEAAKLNNILNVKDELGISDSEIEIKITKR